VFENSNNLSENILHHGVRKFSAWSQEHTTGPYSGPGFPNNPADYDSCIIVNCMMASFVNFHGDKICCFPSD
jgi:hypothetical protein